MNWERAKDVVATVIVGVFGLLTLVCLLGGTILVVYLLVHALIYAPRKLIVAALFISLGTGIASTFAWAFNRLENR